MQVVRDLVRLADQRSELGPSIFGLIRHDRAAARRSLKERARLRPVVASQRHRRLAFPRLPPDDAPARADRIGHATQQGGEVRGAHALGRQHLKGADDEGVAREDRQRFSVGRVDRRSAATFSRVVKTRKVVVHQRGAMQKLNGAGRRVRVFFRPTTREIHGVAQQGPQASPAPEAGVPHGFSKAWRHASPSGDGFQVVFQSRFQKRM